MLCGYLKSPASIALAAHLLGAGGILALSSVSFAEDAQLCSTVPQTSDVTDSASSRRGLIENLAKPVPSDPSACVPSYCQASLGKPEEVRMASGEGLAAAYARLAAEDEDAAQLINNLAGSISCDEIVAKSYAAGCAESLEHI